ncbi:hypothetical protein FB446DRAFT_630031 [Lentinula raphanica]|nr:hypothetical protein FB446DRAFT_630031 [Lentinula raphanica]
MKLPALKELFSSNKEHTIAVIQYERDGYSVGREDQLHWALVVVTSDESHDPAGPCWQVYDRHYNDGTVIWELYDGHKVYLEHTTKCIGGVKVGSIKKSELKSLKEILSAHHPTPKFPGWNCRDWVIEVIAILQQNGWIYQGVIPSQAFLLPGLRSASVLTINSPPNPTTNRRPFKLVDSVTGELVNLS